MSQPMEEWKVYYILSEVDLVRKLSDLNFSLRVYQFEIIFFILYILTSIVLLINDDIIYTF